MKNITVATQAEFDAAWEKHKDDRAMTILIDSPRGVWITVWASGSASVQASGSATVRASGSATVRAYDSATVRASGSASVQASGSATVRASGSASVRASGEATIRAYDSATVWGASHVAVHLHSARVTVSGGVVIDVTALGLTDPQAWVDHTGAEVRDGLVVLYKSVDRTLAAGHGHRTTLYPIGETVTAPDWRDDHECGGGLHASPYPHQALHYYPGAERMLEVTVPLADLRPIPGGVAKAKARMVTVVREVALDGGAIGAAS